MSARFSAYLFFLTALSPLGLVRADSTSLEKAAWADGARRVGDVLLSAKPEGEESIRALLCGKRAVETALRSAVAGCCRYEAFRVDGRGVGCVVVRLLLDDLRAAWSNEHGEGGMGEAFASLGKGSVVVVGLARRRVGEFKLTTSRVGWENTTSTGLALALQAARDDALAVLEERLTEKGEVVEGRGLPANWRSAVRWGKPVYEVGQVCRVRARVPVGDALGRLGSVRGESVPHPSAALKDGAPASVRVGEGLKEGRDSDGMVVEATGFGMAPLGQTLRPAARGRWLDPPPWASRRLVASGRGADVDPIAAKRAARIDAMVKLAREVDSLPLPDVLGSTVRAFVLAHPGSDDVWSAFLNSVRVVDERFSAGEATAAVEIELGRLWDSIQEQARQEGE